jgi:hypothetical protein
MSIEAMAWVANSQLGVGTAKKLLLLVMANYASPKGDNIFPAVGTLAASMEHRPKDDGSPDPRQVRRLLRDLEDDGLIRHYGIRTLGRNQTKVYSLPGMKACSERGCPFISHRHVDGCVFGMPAGHIARIDLLDQEAQFVSPIRREGENTPPSNEGVSASRVAPREGENTPPSNPREGDMRAKQAREKRQTGAQETPLNVSEPSSESKTFLSEPSVSDAESGKLLTVLTETQRLCRLHAELLVANGYERKLDPDSPAWVKAMDGLLRIDGIPPERVERLLRWTMADPWWSAHILSPSALRTRYDQLRAIANRKHSGGPAPQENLSDEFFDRVDAENKARREDPTSMLRRRGYVA